ncbi:MAG TPA: membrane protein insertase YidC [Candidatus Tripitaka californicus]|uniref:membrane protein insertase YidC n=1 Tax=Candidatus Tripitaka californicus TaxID=3367616 RepID=UPI004029CA70
MDRKALLGLVLCSLVMFLYYALFLPWMCPPGERKGQPIPAERPGVKAPTIPSIEKKEAKISPPTPAVQPPAQEERLLDNIILENELLRTVWTNEGAALKDGELKKFKDYKGHDRLCFISPMETSPSPLTIEEVMENHNLSRHRYQVVEVTSNRVVFQTTLGNELRLTKIVSLQEGKYHVDLEVVLENLTQADLPVRYSMASSTQICPEGTPELDMASVVGVDIGGQRVKLIQKSLGELLKSPERNESHGIAWAGGMNKYFATILRPLSSNLVSAVDSKAVQESNDKKKANLWVSLHTNTFTLPAQGAERHDYTFFIGPKREDILKDYNLEKLLGFGAFTPLSKALLKILKAFYVVIPNYGVAIIILTFSVKAILFPLTRKSQMSLYRMQQLQPHLEQLKEQHKKDKQKMAQEQMELFKKHGVNPMSGCLPIALQMPIFYALFRTLQLSFEMRQAPFLLWINDLSQPDKMYIMPFVLPFLGNSINALPIIMTVASIFQMRLMPKSTDPKAVQQQQLMRIMPVFFAFILCHMPSGLVLYWTVSTILSVGEQLLIKRMLARLKSGP